MPPSRLLSPAAAGPAGHRRRGAHQYRPGPLPLRRPGAAGQPGHCGRCRHRLRPGGRNLRRIAGTLPAARATSFTSPASPGTGSAKALFLLGGLGSAPPQSQLALLFEFLAVALAALIPWGSGADRCASPPAAPSPRCWPQSSFLSLAHWVWGGGWLAQLGVNFSSAPASSIPAARPPSTSSAA
jgi:hypothetical protein